VKILDKYILKSYMITFATVFVILFFIFVLQGIWLFISELAGKDLDLFTILKFLSFYAPTIVPMVLPLSVLLAAIMTFGSFSENYEFAAMKSSGISLNRAMRFLSFAILGLSLITFIFANNVIPRAQYNFLNLRKDIMQQKPAMAIAEGQFNTIGGINIKVEKKSGENGELLEGVIMHVKNANYGFGANTVIKAKNGILGSDNDSNLLQLVLLDGNYYENIQPKDFNAREKKPFAKSSFKKYIINIDLSKVYEVENVEDYTSEKMLNISELNYTLDSLEKHYDEEIISFSDNVIIRTDGVFNSSRGQDIKKENKDVKDILALMTRQESRKIVELAKNNITSTEFNINNGETDLKNKKKSINSHWIVIHEKFVMGFSCLLMFFLGAPLGAIIRKGGLGLPMVFAIIIFIVYHFLNLFGRKLAEQDAIPVFLGVWLSTIILVPFAILFTYRATNDIGIMINFDWITDPFKKLASKINKQKN
jgi:lipopolysaccharide export system permease protein